MEFTLPIETSKKNLNQLQCISILVAEDDENIRELLMIFLESLGAKVELADDGLQGLNKAMNNSYDLILMDLNLPKMSGEKIAEKLRKVKNNIPIIGISGYEDDYRRERCLMNGFNEYISKPFQWEDLVEKIKIQTQHPRT